MTSGPSDPTTASFAPDRRAVLAGLAALLVSSDRALATSGESWPLATQIIAGTRVADPTMLALAVRAIQAKFGTSVVETFLSAVLARDAANIAEPFADPQTEAAARAFMEAIYTGEIEPGRAAGFHQALAWQVLTFAKPPSVCGPGFGWWTKPPAEH
jgi:hypothetical protein